jgi:uncharacterized protein YpmS
MKQKVKFFGKINQIDNLSQTNEKKEKTQINKIRNEKGDITTTTNEIQKIIREYFENLHSNNWKIYQRYINL